MTIQGALNDLSNLINSSDIPMYYKPSLKKIKETIELEMQPKMGEWRHYEKMITCSRCDAEYYDDIMEYCGDNVPRFCPNCGSYNGGGEE